MNLSQNIHKPPSSQLKQTICANQHHLISFWSEIRLFLGVLFAHRKHKYHHRPVSPSVDAIKMSMNGCLAGPGPGTCLAVPKVWLMNFWYGNTIGNSGPQHERAISISYWWCVSSGANNIRKVRYGSEVCGALWCHKEKMNINQHVRTIESELEHPHHCIRGLSVWMPTERNINHSTRVTPHPNAAGKMLTRHWLCDRFKYANFLCKLAAATRQEWLLRCRLNLNWRWN